MELSSIGNAIYHGHRRKLLIIEPGAKKILQNILIANGCDSYRVMTNYYYK